MVASTTGHLVVRGLITYISMKFGLEKRVEVLEDVEGNLELDLNMCVQMNLVRAVDKEKDKNYPLINKVRSIILPNQARTTISNVNNWLYDVAAVPQVPHQNPVQDDPMENEQDEYEQEQVGQEQVQRMMFNDDWCARIEAEQLRPGAEIRRNNHMLEVMMSHFDIQYPPPGSQ